MVTSQKERLNKALADGRKWDIERWKDLFLGNPVMYRLAMGLIWGIYECGKLMEAFCYREDGAFNVENKEEVHSIEELLSIKESTLSKEVKIGLVHPLELSQESLKAWKEHLENCDIDQPIEQLDRPVFPMTEEEAGKEGLERFSGMVMTNGKDFKNSFRQLVGTHIWIKRYFIRKIRSFPWVLK